MSHDDDPLKALWTTPDTEELMPTLNLTAARNEADKLDRSLHRRNLLEMTVGVGLMGFFGLSGGQALYEGALGRGLAMLLLTAGVGLVVHTFRTRGRAPRATPDQGTAGFLAAYRAELSWQAALLRDVPRWYLGPLVPGVVALYAAVVWPQLSQLPTDEMGAALLVAAVPGLLVPGAVFLGIAWLNRSAARKLEEQLEGLPELDQSSRAASRSVD